MAMDLGHYSIDDLLAVENQTILEYGVNTVQQVLQNDLDNWNAIIMDALSYLSMDTTDRADRFGVSHDFEMFESDEYDRGVAGKDAGGTDVAYPMLKHKVNVGWTLDYMKVSTPADMARVQIGIQNAHQRSIYTGVRRALYRPTNYSVLDRLVDNYTLPVKRLLNADSNPIPNGPYGATFNGATHTHYLANATLTDAALTSAITSVAEHTNTSRIVVIIAETNIAGVEALTSYTAATGDLLVAAEDADRTRFSITQGETSNRRIGVYKGIYEVWVKPWALANYALILDLNGPKPLKRRQRPQLALRGLRMSSQSQLEPLRVDFFESEFGFGVFGRSSAAVLQFNNATYQDPF